MKRDVAVVVWASVWLSCGCSLVSEAAAAPASAFARMPAIESAVLSPSGQRIAWVDNSAASSVIQVLDLAKGAQVKRVDVPEVLNVHGLDWTDDETLLIHQLMKPADRPIERPAHEWLRTAAAQVAAGTTHVLLKYTNDYRVTGTRLIAVHPGKPRTVILSALTIKGYKPDIGEYVDRGNNFSEGYDLYEVDTLTGKDQVIGWGTPFTRDWILGANGQAVARSEWFPRSGVYTVLHRRGSHWQEIFRRETGEQPTLLGLSRDGTAVLMGANLGRKHFGVWRLPLFGGDVTLVMDDESSDITRLVRDPYSQDVLGGWTGGLTPELRWIDRQAETRANSLSKTFGGQPISVISRSADDSRALVGVGARSAPVTYYLVDFNRGTADTVGEEYPGLVGVPLGDIRAITFKARDGYDVQAYLTLPSGLKAEKLALVILDYPWSDGRDGTTFHPIAQFLATRGYAVLQPQPRKDAKAAKAAKADSKWGPFDWGDAAQDDVTAGVRTMVAQGIADPRRVCIVGGWGHGAIAGAAFTPELYACAISVSGVADFTDLIKHHREAGSEPTLPEFLEEYPGRAERPDKAALALPRAASNIRAPILLLHDVDNPLVPFDQARKLRDALGGQLPHELIELPGYGTRTSSAETWSRTLTEMERFLAKHLSVKEAS